ncbi:hypothetical protein AVEN_57000-1 [Araneus ventricosus]|uniref:Uncharacterized protein n=1 Tax=Araneus ventricosus TaxID=182803 RepID=A0A4Y2JWC6_ARAVE|nr:hypothetical protein AVEN_57000-1 [Araneus ventricosus]
MEDISSGNGIYFSYMPSLLHIASVKIVSHLLKDFEIGRMLDKDRPMRSRHYEPWRIELWRSIERTAEEKLPPLPPSLGTKVVGFLRPMYYQVIGWLLDNDLYWVGHIYFYIKCDVFCWKSDGRIDRERTAKEIIHKELFDLKDCFILACTYYLTHEIIVLWGRIKKDRLKRSCRKGINPAVRFWMKYLKKGQVKPMDELTKKYFHPLNVGPKDISFRLSCYFSFLPQEFRQFYLLSHLFSTIHTDDIALCLNQMDERERMELFQLNPTNALIHCIQWPFYALFLKAANEFSSYLRLDDFYRVLDHMITFYILEGWDFYEPFNEFWNLIPDSYKDEIKEDEKYFNVIEAILKYNKINPPEPLMEIIGKYYFG